MPPPTKVNPANQHQNQDNFLGIDISLFNGPSYAPPEFKLEASPAEDEVCWENEEQACLPEVVEAAAPECGTGANEDLFNAIDLARSKSDHGWANQQLAYMETVLVPLQNVIGAWGGAIPVVGDAGHHETYSGWGMPKSETKALKNLHKAMWETDDPKKQLKKLKDAKKSFGKVLDLVNAFAKGKKWQDNPGFKAIKDAVNAQIHTPWAALESKVEARIPVKEKKKKNGGGSGGGGGSRRGYNRQQITNFNKLPGLDKRSGNAPAPGSLAESVEANMARDLKITRGSVEDLLYVNMPDLIAGKGKKDTAKKAWGLIKNYRNKHLNPVFERYSKDPNNPELRAEMEAAIAQMEAEIGPEVRAIARAWWVNDSAQASTYATDMDDVGVTLAEKKKELTTAYNQEGFDPQSLDTASLAETFKDLKSRVYQMRDNSKEFGLEKDAKKTFDNASYDLMKKLRDTASKFGSKKFGMKQMEAVMEKVQIASEQLEVCKGILKGAAAAEKVRRDQLKPILSRIDDPEQVPLVKPVKKHAVTVEYTAEPGEVVTASYATKPESTIGIYENVWSPTGISDEKGSFSRPKGPARGAKICQELKTNHGFTDSEAKILGAVATGEGDYHSLNTVDMMRISLGFIQFAGSTFVKMLTEIKQTDPAYFDKQFGQYGILVTTGMAKSDIPPISKRNDRFVAGDQVGNQVEQSKQATLNWYAKLVVYDHSTGEWVQGLEAMAVLQGDPRYLALIQESGRDEQMQLMQIKKAGKEFLRNLRTTKVKPGDVGLPKDDPHGSFEFKDILNNEKAMYAICATAVAAGVGKAQGKGKSFLKGIVKKYNIQSVKDLLALDQSIISAYFMENYSKWSRPDNLAGETGSPLSQTYYSGKP